MNTRMDRETMNTAMMTGVVALVVLGAIVIVFWGVRGFLPGSRLMEQPLPAPNDLDANKAVFKMFFTNWCPHCRNAKPKWASFETLLKNNSFTYGGKTITLEKINCEVDKGQCARYRADAYPTYKLITDKKMYEYIGPPDVTAWRTFLKSALGTETPAS